MGIRFKAMPTRIEIQCVSVPGGGDASGLEDLLVGPFPKKIKAGDVTWEIEEQDDGSRCIAAQFLKAESMEKWPCFIEGDGHPIIDTRLVKLFTQGLGMGGMDIFE